MLIASLISTLWLGAGMGVYYRIPYRYVQSSPTWLWGLTLLLLLGPWSWILGLMFWIRDLVVHGRERKNAKKENRPQPVDAGL
jgi:hypothetical protein